MFDVRNVFDKAWSDFKKYPGLLIGASLAMMVLGMAIGFASQLSVALVLSIFQSQSQIIAGLGMLVTNTLNLTVSTYLQIGLMAMCLKIIRKEDPKFGDMFGQGGKLIPALIAAILITLGVMLGMVLLIIPGIIFAILSILTQWFVIDRGLDPISALKASVDATKSCAGNIFLCGLIVLVLCFASIFTCFTGLLVVMPLTMLVIGHIYEDVRAAAEAPE